MKNLALLFAAALAAIPSIAADNLEPDDTYFQNYHDQVNSTLKEVFAPDVLTRMTVEPSFSVEYAVALKEDAGANKIVSITAEQQLWKFQVLEMMKRGEITSSDMDGKNTTADEIKRLEASLPKDPNEVKVERCEVAVDSGLAARIVSVWKQMLLGVHVVPYEGGLDGVFYRFSMPVDGKDVAGQTWSPNPDSKPGRLVEIAETMRAYCQKKNETMATKLGGQVGALLKRLNP